MTGLAVTLVGDLEEREEELRVLEELEKMAEERPVEYVVEWGSRVEKLEFGAGGVGGNGRGEASGACGGMGLEG